MRISKKNKWVIFNLALAILLPIAYSIWINHEVRYEYEMGYRTTTSADSISIPIAGFTLLLWLSLLILNICIAVIIKVHRLTNRSINQGVNNDVSKKI